MVGPYGAASSVRCACSHEAGDSDCAVHPTCPDCGVSLTDTQLARCLRDLQAWAEARIMECVKVEQRNATVGDGWHATNAASERRTLEAVIARITPKTKAERGLHQ